MRFLITSSLFVCVSFPVFSAGITENACLRSERSPGREICSCAQNLADQMLTRSDQRAAAEIIAEPDIYLEYKYTENQSKQTFLERYRTWGETTAQYCAQ